MKKIYGFGILALLLFAFFSFNLVLAEEGYASVTVDSVNDSSDEQVPSNFRQGWEKFKIGFIRNESLKAERELQLARWKIAEARIAAKNGNFDRAEKAMEAYDSILVRVQERISRLENGSMTPGLDQALQVHEQRLANLNIFLESANLTDEQRAKIEIRISKIENNSAHLEQIRIKIEEKRQERLDDLQNRTTRIEERGDTVKQRIEEREDRRERLQERMNRSNSSDDGSNDGDEDSQDDSDEDSKDDSSSNSTNSTN